MNEIWFTSDTHLGHKNILEYEKDARPFETVEEMNEDLISNWNNTVRPKDIVWHLGDVAFGRSNIELVGRLNGRKKLILGNHDVYNNNLYLVHFEKLFGVVFWRRCILSHVPVSRRSFGARAILNVHGHTHSRHVMMSIDSSQVIVTQKEIWRDPSSVQGTLEVRDYNYFNVSCEAHNLRPVNSSVIMDRLKEIDQ